MAAAYAAANVRADLTAAHAHAWEFLGSAGTWLSSEQKLAIAAEVRAGAQCGTCAARKEALSPEWVTDPHVQASSLPDPWVDIVHRIVTDPGRLTRAALDGLSAAGIDDATYTELLGVCVFTMSVDMFCRAAGLRAPELRTPNSETGRAGSSTGRSDRRHRSLGSRLVNQKPDGPEGLGLPGSGFKRRSWPEPRPSAGAALH